MADDLSVQQQVEAWAAGKQRRETETAAVVAAEASKENADRHSANMTLAALSGVPVDVLDAETQPYFEMRLRQKQDKMILARSAPLRRWLVEDPNNAKIAHDDLPELSFWGDVSNRVAAGAMKSGAAAAYLGAQTQAQAAQDAPRSFGQVLIDEAADGAAPGNPASGINEAFDLATTPARALGRWAYAQANQMLGIDTAGQSAQLMKTAVDLRRSADALPRSADATAFLQSLYPDGAPQDFSSVAQRYAESVATNPTGFLKFAFETVLEQAPQLAAAAAAGAVTRNPAMTAAVAGLGSYTTENTDRAMQYFADKGFDFTKPGEVDRLMKSPEILREAAEAGHLRGFIIGAANTLSMGAAGMAFGNTPIVSYIANAVTQGVIDSTGEYLGQVGSGQPVDWADILSEGIIGSVAEAPGEMAAMAGARVTPLVQQVERAGQMKTFFETLSGQAQKSKLRARMPEKFADFVKKATADGPVEKLYVDAGKFSEYFQSAGMDPQVAAKDLGLTAGEFQAAIESGGDIAIQTGEYAAKLAGSEHDQFMIENMRLRPEDLSVADSVEVNAQIAEILDRAREEADTASLADLESQSFRDQIRNEISSRLQVAGRAADVSRVEGEFYAELYGAMAERNGLTVDELLRQIPLPEFRGDVPQGAQPRQLDALETEIATQRRYAGSRGKTARARRGKSLTDFVADLGVKGDRGEIAAAIGGGKAARKGQKAIVRDDGRGLDEVAYAAIEAGYMADDPVVQEFMEASRNGTATPDLTRPLLDALRRDAGSKEGEFFATPEPDEEARHQDFKDWLAEIGANIDDPPATIRRRAEAWQAKRSYDQFAGRMAQTMSMQRVGRAIDMEKAGIDREDIWNETGFFRGVDGKWRFEISDSDANFKELMLNDVTLTNGQQAKAAEGVLNAYLRHPKLYEAYPDLRSVRVYVLFGPGVVKEGSAGRGSWDGQQITVRANTEEAARSVLLHEIQHVIQDIEGFARGGNPDTAMEVYEGPQVEEIQAGIDRLKAKRQTAIEAHDAAAVIKLDDQIREGHEFLRKAAKLEGYMRLAGETEARNVQRRDNEARAGAAPDTPWWTQDRWSSVQIVEVARPGDAFAAHEPAPIDGPTRLFTPPSVEERAGVLTGEMDPLSTDGDWRDGMIQAEFDDGEAVTLPAGELVDVINRRREAAMNLLRCVNGN